MQKSYFDTAQNSEVSIHCLTAQKAKHIMDALKMLVDDKLRELRIATGPLQTLDKRKKSADLTNEINELNQFIIDLGGSYAPVKKMLEEQITAAHLKDHEKILEH